MQYVTIGVTRSRDMLSVDTRIQVHGTPDAHGSKSKYIGGVTYSEPFTLTVEDAEALGDLVLKAVRDRIERLQLPF